MTPGPKIFKKRESLALILLMFKFCATLFNQAEKCAIRLTALLKIGAFFIIQALFRRDHSTDHFFFMFGMIRNGKINGGTFPKFALYPDITTQHFYKCFRNG